MKLQWNPKVLLITNAVGAALAVAVAVLMFEVDGIVNVTLYGYGLQFNYEWATPYWTFLRLTVGLAGGIACINGFAIAYVILTGRALPRSKTVTPRPKVAAPRLQPTLKTLPKIEKEKRPAAEEADVQIATIPMVCNKCGKVFTQPLCMFDFKSGKPRLVNVCPYCNAILAVAGNSKLD